MGRVAFSLLSVFISSRTFQLLFFRSKSTGNSAHTHSAEFGNHRTSLVTIISLSSATKHVGEIPQID
jgi:hypothetical protein